MITWTRAELKQRAKESVNRNYWWFVLACLILTLVGGTGGGGGGSSYSSSNNNSSSYSSDYNYFDDDDYDWDDDDYYSDDSDSDFVLPLVGLIAGLSIGLFLIIFAVAIVFSTFICAPIRVGIYRFFLNAREGRRNFGDVIFVFSSGHYLNVVKIMFLASLKITLWYLLFIIPGIIKAYEYRMIPYILSEHPEIDSKTAFQMTKTQMDGEKLSTWVLELSFFGWACLSLLTCGILSIFWVNPYSQATYAELYAVLRQKTFQTGYAGYGQNGYNQNGYNQNGYDQNGYNQNGYNQNGYNQNGYNQNGYNQNGYNQNGYGQNSYDQNNYQNNDYNN